MKNKELILKVLKEFHHLENIKIEIDPKKENSVGYVATIKDGTTFIPIEKEIVIEINTKNNQVVVYAPLDYFPPFLFLYNNVI